VGVEQQNEQQFVLDGRAKVMCFVATKTRRGEEVSFRETLGPQILEADTFVFGYLLRQSDITDTTHSKLSELKPQQFTVFDGSWTH